MLIKSKVFSPTGLEYKTRHLQCAKELTDSLAESQTEKIRKSKLKTKADV